MRKKSKVKVLDGQWDMNENIDALWDDPGLRVKIFDFLLAGVPSSDEKGHSSMISCRVHPLITRMVEELMEQYPSGWLKVKSDLHRIALSIGLIFIGRFAEIHTGKSFASWEKKFEKLRVIELNEKFKQLEFQVKKMERDLKGSKEVNLETIKETQGFLKVIGDIKKNFLEGEIEKIAPKEGIQK